VLLCGALLLATLWAERADHPLAPRTRLVAVLAAFGLFGLAALFWQQTRALLPDAKTIRRSFFGVLRVQELAPNHPDAHAFRLWHGATVHGYQFVSPALQDVPAGYFTRSTGVGACLELYRPEGGRSIGIIGLGAGTLAAYGRPGDTLRFYEIDPDVVEIAKTDFTFLARSVARCEIVVGDARLSLEREPDRLFDLLVLDAFSGDSVPVHLLTREAFELYDRHLVPGGVLALHVSSRHLDLPRAVYPVAAALGFQTLEVRSLSRPATLTLGTSWMILSRDASFLRRVAEHLAPLQAAGDVQAGTRTSAAQGRVWTDNYSNLLGILK